MKLVNIIVQYVNMFHHCDNSALDISYREIDIDIGIYNSRMCAHTIIIWQQPK